VCLATTTSSRLPACVCKMECRRWVVMGDRQARTDPGRHTHPSDGRGRIHCSHCPRNSTATTATTEAFPASLADKQNSHHHHHPIPPHLIRPRTTSTSNSTSRRDPHPRSSSQRPLFGLGMSRCSPRPPRGRNSVFDLSLLCALCSALCSLLYAV
jgi:hypothetical protein